MHTTSQVKAAPAAQPSIAKPAAQPLMASAVDAVEAPSLTEQMDRARLGHHFGAISVLPPDPPSIQPKRMVASAQRLPAFRPMGQGRANPAPVIPAGWSVPKVQTKLTVGEPNDPYEQEADRMADQVMRMAEPRVQAKCSCGGEAGPDGECAACKAQRLGVQRQVQDQMPEEESVVQAQSDTAPAEAAPDLESRLSGNRGSGQALPADTRGAMEAAFGADFGGVRVHTGNEAVQMNKELSAQAFTHGSDIYFNAGKYEPESTRGKGLLAHELTHVVQQGANKQIQRRDYSQAEISSMRSGNVRATSTDQTIASRFGFVAGDIIFRLGSSVLARLISNPVTHGGIYLGGGLVHDMVGFGNRTTGLNMFYNEEAADPSVVKIVRFSGPYRQLIIDRVLRNIQSRNFWLPSESRPWNLFSSSDDYGTATCLEYAHAQFIHAISQLSTDTNISTDIRSSIVSTYIRSGNSVPDALIPPQVLENFYEAGTPFVSVESLWLPLSDTGGENINPTVFENRWEGRSETRRIGSSRPGTLWELLFPPTMMVVERLNSYTYRSFERSRFFTVIR